MSSILRSTGIVALSTLASRILGFIRDMLLAAYFGASGHTDAFFVAFKIPNLFRRFVAEGALTISFIPVYTEYLVNHSGEEALELAQKTLSILLLILVVLVAAGEYFSPEIVNVFAIGFTNDETISLAVLLNRIMFPYLFFVSLVAFAMGVLNSHKRFFSSAFAPVFLNLGIIFGVLVLSDFFASPLVGVSIGVLIGGLLQFLLQIPYMVKTGFKMRISVDFKHRGIRKIFTMLAPALFGMAVYQINSLIITVMASYLAPGSISYIYYSDRLTELVLGVFIVSIGNVILPEMSRMTAGANYDELKVIYIKSIRGALFMAIPACAALMGIGWPIISTIFMHNNFSLQDASLTYRALFCASIGITFLAVLRLTTPTFYALKDTKTPVLGAALALVFNIAAGYILMGTSLRHAGLTLALSLSSAVQVVLLVFLLRKKIGKIGLRPLCLSVVKFISASLLMLAVCLAIAGRIDWALASSAKRCVVLSIVIISGMFVYAAACYFMRVDEVRYITKRLFKKKLS
ncbi:MAG: murein biosynthesis integral membrane protein MurJ [Spirochaetia bacterium]|jgi:putative peptidoglycan lipid II flippase|nr:murein biosynthesis integral membrane protein MurJ [Spirochaetia bacterium]